MHAKRRTILKFTMLGVFFALAALVSNALREEHTQRWARYSPALVKRLWSESGDIHPILDTHAVQARIEATLGKKSAEGEHVPNDAIARGISELLSVYSSGDFEKFWRFRFPDGKYEASETDHKALLLQISEFPTYGATPYGGDPNDLKRQMRYIWDNANVLTNTPLKVPFCISCFQGFNIEYVNIYNGTVRKDGRDLAERMRDKENIGTTVYRGLVKSPLANTSDLTTSTVVEARLMVKLKSNFVHPVHFVAIWDREKKFLVPIEIGIPVSNKERALLIF